jgi:hypothetical protein
MLIDAKQTTVIQHFKEIFGLGSLKDIRDFAQQSHFPSEAHSNTLQAPGRN